MTRQILAVLTGDLVGSTKAPRGTTDRTIEEIDLATRDLRGPHLRRFARFRGDGWQMVLPPEAGLHAVLLILARLRARPDLGETRIALGLGGSDRLPEDSTGAASGAAFTLSGRLLDEMPATRRLAMAVAGRRTPAYASILALLDFLTGRWTPPQAEATAMALAMAHGTTQAEIAARLGITRQAVQLRLAGAGFGALETVLHGYVLAPPWEAA